MIEITLPGTGGMLPLPLRFLTCLFASFEGGSVMIDCGECTQVALRKADCRVSRLSLLLITHIHADHIAGLAGLCLTLNNAGKTSPLVIYGPRGLSAVVSSLLCIARGLSFPVEVRELGGGDGSFNFTFDSERRQTISVSYLPLRHGIPCYGYRLSLSRLPVFDPAAAKALEIPVRFYKVLHGGQSVTLEDGRVIEPQMVLTGDRKPLSVCYFTDTLPFPALSDFARDADLLISEGMYGDETMRESVSEKKHMMFADSAKTAKSANVKALWLTHYSPALPNPKQYIGNAQKIFKNTTAAYDGIRTTL
ncbi:ribonuclease Z [Clostridia bacterium]|nr:ribonuclease Z [Clostridia bacterium]